MRILWANHLDISSPTRGGAERTIFEVCRRLVECGHSVTLLTGTWRSTELLPDEVAGIRILRFPGRILPHLLLPAELWNRNRYDVVVDDLSHALPWFSPWFSSVPTIAFFRHLHARTLPGQTNAPLARALSAIERCYPIVYGGTTPFVTESMTSERDLIELGVPASRIHRIPPGVDTQLFHPRVKTDFPQVVYFGGLRRYKRPEHAILAFRKLVGKRSDAQLVVVGVGDSLPRLASLVRTYKMQSCVKFVGRVPDSKLSELVSESWVNIHCSLAEGWGLSIMEASAAGVPTVGYRCPGVDQTIAHGINGLKVDDGNIDQLARATQEAINTSRDWTVKCRNYSLKYTWEETTRAWKEMLDATARGEAPRFDSDGLSV